jgi:squalene-associated FAD-dependent desaturase
VTGEPGVVVIGGGLAGLSAALTCADAGARVTLLEARPRLGGATFSFERDGLVVDNGQHVFLRCCTAYRSFLRRIGSDGLVRMQPRLEIPVRSPSGRSGILRRSDLPSPLHLAGALARYPFLTAAERMRAVPVAAALARMDPDDPALDRRTFGDWLADHGQTPNAVAALWNLIALPALNVSAGDASLALAVKVFRTGLLSSRDGADIGAPTVPLSRLHGDAASRALARAGADVHIRRPVRRIGVDVAPGGGFVVETDAGPVEASAVVLAVPHDAASPLLPPGAVPDGARLTELGVSPIVNVHVVYDRPVMDCPFVAGLDTPVQWAFDRTGPSGLDRGQYVAISVSGADREVEERTEDLRDRFLPALADLFPAARTATVERFFVTRERAATIRHAPGTRALRPSARTRIPGLFLAGAWTDTGWPATMEGAVRSGVVAAREALLLTGGLRAPAGTVAA